MLRKKNFPSSCETGKDSPSLMAVSFAFHFAVGAVGYPLLELLWRSRTHPSMALAGGSVMLFAAALTHSRLSKSERAVLTALFTLFVELLLGIIFNIWLDCNVWDYSRFRLHLFGQICPAYAALWFLLSFPITLFADKATAVLRHLSHRLARHAKKELSH